MEQVAPAWGRGKKKCARTAAQRLTSFTQSYQLEPIVLCQKCELLGTLAFPSDHEFVSDAETCRSSTEWDVHGFTSQCRLCVSIKTAVRAELLTWRVGCDISQEIRVWTELRRSHDSLDTATLYLTKPVSDVGMKLPLVDFYKITGPDSGIMSTDSGSRPLKPYLDLPLIRSWLSTCPTRTSCGRIRERCRSKPSALRVVDCFDWCVTKKPWCCEYLALSYVWGTPDRTILVATTSNIDLLGAKNSLIQGCISGQAIPRIVEDAIKLTIRLGFRYLWVDSLSIIQNDAEETRRNVHGMATIYAGAHTVLVVPNCTNARSSIPGLAERRATLHGRVEGSLGAVEIKTRPNLLQHHIKRGSWSKRGWTLQEQLFGKRLLYLTSHEAFLCTRRFWRRESEDRYFYPETEEIQPLSSYDWLMDSKQVDVDDILSQATSAADEPPRIFAPSPETEIMYIATVEDYTHRDLTYASDRLPAFIGIYDFLNSDHKQLSADITRGILPSLVPQALLWVLEHPIHEQEQAVDEASEQRSTWAWSSLSKGVKHPWLPSMSLIYEPEFGTCKRDGLGTGQPYREEGARLVRLKDMLQEWSLTQSNVACSTFSAPDRSALEGHDIISNATVTLEPRYLERLQELCTWLTGHMATPTEWPSGHAPSELYLGQLGFWAVCLGLSLPSKLNPLTHKPCNGVRAFFDRQRDSVPNEIAILARQTAGICHHLGLLLHTDVQGQSRRLGVIEFSLTALTAECQPRDFSFRYVVLC